jgi:hypothetical protein
MEHYLVRASIIPVIISYIMEEYAMTEKEALDAFYLSATGSSLADDETGLYGQSPLFIFSLYRDEVRKKIHQ